MNTRRKLVVTVFVFAFVVFPVISSRAQDVRGAASIALLVPEDAIVFVNDVRTRSTGLRRLYRSNLQPGVRYRYRLRVELRRGNQILEATDTVFLRAGGTANLVFSEARFSPRTTSRKSPSPEKVRNSPSNSEADGGDVRNSATLDKDRPSVRASGTTSTNKRASAPTLRQTSPRLRPTATLNDAADPWDSPVHFALFMTERCSSMENAISRASALNRIALALGEAGDKQQELAALTQAVEVAEEMALASNLIFSIAMTLATDPVTEYKQDDLTHPAARRMKKAFTANEKQLAKQLVEAMQEN